MRADLRPFRIAVPEGALSELKERLARTRWPDEPPIAPWATGTSVAYARELCAYWHDAFDWRAWEARLNAFAQFKVALHGIDLHFIHVRSPNPDAVPLLLSHGWPGSVLEFHKLIPLLAPHFHVVAPSLPGYTLSFAPGQPRFGTQEIAACFADLMAWLGYARFGAQGGDWGGFISSVLGHRYPERLVGIHLNLLALPREPKIAAPTQAEAAYLKDLRHFAREETGYQWIQGTKPQTLAFALTDSPAGLAAWIAEKFRGWSDCGGAIENAISRDELLANVSLYWFTGAIGSSFWPYYARRHGPWPIPEGEKVRVPTGYAAFPKEIVRPPRSQAETMYADLRRWTDMPRGGHFAALEQPALLAEDVIAFFAGLRA
ncbi:MAG: epoxide hydrolase 1 [Betaproteobacteria bacterium]|nr:epoxide hydrolase 1 [Betaproteobacteria bacterium]MDH5221771.1 epoxide hydrolase 1 [Betaproteobacteria bacterium]MDH5350058.1 epoxide hydrolase 1 [Betaproteobacteria bacterium]